MVRYRTTGLTAGVVGAQWERKDDDQEIARRVLNLLGDRRMLWKDFSLEIEEQLRSFGDPSAPRPGIPLGQPGNRRRAGPPSAPPAGQYDLDVSEELATIVPDDGAWFFERFDSIARLDANPESR